MAKRLSMTFVTAQGGQSSMTLDAPKSTLVAADVNTVMQSIITQNLFNTSKGDLTGIKSAEVVTTTTETLI